MIKKMNCEKYVTGSALNLPKGRAVNINELISFLQSNLNITKFGARNCKIDNKSARELAKLLNLTALDLGWNNIVGKGVKELANLSNLTKLSLQDNKISTEDIKELAKFINLTFLI